MISNYATTPEGYTPTVIYEWHAGDTDLMLVGCTIFITPGGRGVSLDCKETLRMIGSKSVYDQIESAAWVQWCETGRAGVKQQQFEDGE